MLKKASHFQLVAILIVLGYFFLMFGNGIISLTHPDEVFYAQTAKEMIQYRSWLAPILFDQAQFEKPILTYWLLIAAFKWFGTTDFAARFFPALFGIIGVLATYWIAILLFNDKKTAFLSGVVLTTSFIYLALSRAVLTDMIFSIWVVLALGFFYYGYTKESRKTGGILFCFIFSALAVLTKGVLGFVLPAGVILVYLASQKNLRYLKGWATVFGLILFLAMILPWHVLMVKWYGYRFIDEYWRNVHWRRIFEAEHAKSDTWYFYLITIAGGIFPWSCFLLTAFGVAWRYLRNSSGERQKTIFLFLWIGVISVIAQSAKSKLGSYVFPVFPAAAILIGRYLTAATDKRGDPFLSKSIRVTSYISAIIFAVSAITGLILSQKYIALIKDIKIIYLFFALTMAAAACLFIFAQRRHYQRAIAAVSSVTVIILIILFLGHGYAEPWVSCKDISDILTAADKSDSAVLCSKFYARGVRFYTDRKIAVIDINGRGFFSPHPIPFLSNDGQVLAFLNSQPMTYGVVKKADFLQLQRMTEGQFALTLLAEVGGKYLLRLRKIERKV